MFKKILCTVLAFVFIASNAFAGTVTISSKKSTVWGNKRVVMGAMALTGAYGTGFACTPHQLGLTKVDKVIFIPRGGSGDYNYAWASSVISVYRNLVSTTKPATTTVSAADSFYVLNKALTAADAETALVVIRPVSGQIARFGIYDALGSSAASTDIQDAVFSSGVVGGDTTNNAIMAFDSTTPGVDLRGKLMGADTVFFDYNTSGRENRLMYSGTSLGNCGDLYVPFPIGNFIKITKKTNSQITSAAAAPLYYIKSKATLTKKFQADVTGTGNNNSGFMCDSTYTSLPRYMPAATVLSSVDNISEVLDFIAIGQ